jgi:hypothetical protein
VIKRKEKKCVVTRGKIHRRKEGKRQKENTRSRSK